MDAPREDPIVTSARREAVVTLCIWLAALVYTIGYYYLFALGRAAADVRLYAGIPDWILFGVLLPWGATYLVSLWFAFVYMQDADLESDLQAAENGQPEDADDG